MADENKLREYLKLVTADLSRARARVRELEGEPVAIVGMACRFPGGVHGPDQLWDLVDEGRDAIGPFPVERGWPEDGHGGFLDGVAEFDADFFGISPREARTMDPQQRLVLESAWEALEHAGIGPSSLRGSRTGVYVGAYYQGYDGLADHAEELIIGNASSVISGRVSYALGLEGPSLTVDTACSSSLVALHSAVTALHRGECTLALAGGVSVMASPSVFVEIARQQGLAADGRCKAFAAAADGTGFAEGVALLVLQRLSEAQAAGRRVLAVVRGTAVNSDGASNGLTAPNGLSQQRVIRQALAAARLSTSDVDLVEAHGTGTTLGDPIEAQAIIATYGQDRETPVRLGSLKSNIGHTQAAAGVGGVIKLVQALRHGRMPRTLHVDEPTPHVNWSAGAVDLLTDAADWPVSPDRPRRAAVSSFGVSGTNAHVILEEPPAAAETTVADAPEVLPWLVSGKGEQGLRAQARVLLDVPGAPAAIGHALAMTRSAITHRAVVLGADRDELTEGLASLADGEPLPQVVTGVVGQPGQVAFVFPGQGTQWVGMGRELLASSPVFAARLAECEQALKSFVDWSVTDVLGDQDALADVEVLQPVLWAVMVSLAEVWRAYGVQPAAVVGHSQGEIAAAVVAGALSLEDGARVICLRSRIAARSLPRQGGMVAVTLPAERVRDRWHIAAVNGPSSCVVSGRDEELDALVAEFPDNTRRVAAAFASHSPHMEAIRDELLAAFEPLRPQGGTVSFMSTVTGRIMPGTELDAEYWYRNVRETVRLDLAVTALAEQGFGTFIEVSGHPVLSASLQDLVDNGIVLATLRRDDGGPRRVLRALGEAHVRGVAVDWTPALGVVSGPAVELPTYAFQRQRYWLDPVGGALTSIDLAGGDTLFTAEVSLAAQPWLAGHAVSGTVLLPGVAFVEMAVRAGDEVGAPRVEELTLHQPLVIPAHHAVPVQVLVGAADGDRRSVTIHSRSGADEWSLHASGTLTAASVPADHLDTWPPAGTPLDLSRYYDELAARGLEYGPDFQGLRAAWRDGDTLWAEVSLPEQDGPYLLHPALFDAAIHASIMDSEENRLPFVWEGVAVHAVGASALRVRIRISADGDLSLLLADESGAPVASVDRLASRPVGTALTRAVGTLFRLDWIPVEATATEVPVCRPTSVADALSDVQRWLAKEGPLAVVTRNAVTVDGTAPNPDAAAIWGLVRSAQSEHPGRFLLVDTDGEALTTEGEPQLAVRGGQAFAPRLARTEATGSARSLNGTVLVTGASGTVGGLVARHLVAEHGVRHLLLLSRRGEVPELAADLAAQGAHVTALACDVGDRDALSAALASIPAAHPLTGVFHAAGVLDDGLVDSLTPERLNRVWRAKADGARHLHELTGDAELAEFVLFSSAAGVLGNAGQGNYAAANTYLDALASVRRSEGLPARSLAWGLWADRSEIMTEDAYDRTVRRGVRPMAAADALALLDAALRTDEPLLLPMDVDLAVLRDMDDLPRLWRGLLPMRTYRPTAQVVTRSLADVPAGERVAVLTDLVLGHTAKVLGRDDRVDIDRPFRDLGFDSLSAVELRNRVNAATGVRLSATAVFSHPTPRALVAKLMDDLFPADAAPEAEDGPLDVDALDVDSLVAHALRDA
ncbi:type I polyketide synthase [Kutzneria sp. CA-103260]|nr:type I polyketide synthase [Kutzneria sp. CA-103260]QUQ64261.1 type I polyketide synthase [Kutzneria sp. CA-103260]